MDPSNCNPEDLRELLGDLVGYQMPFGKFGPSAFPPNGVYLVDLPEEYLAWFAHKGFPSGRLGRLMRQVYELKVIGMDELFQPIREHHGGRTVVRKQRPKKRDFPE